MTREEKLTLLQEWQDKHHEIQEQFDALGECFGDVSGSLFDSVWGLFASYTNVISALVGDNYEWLDWFRFESKFGVMPIMAGPSSDKMRSIKTLDDLLWLIEECE